ncbi:methionine sulfoxide reductase [Synergistales bacterium]|nr:methionine sulfoxide reductase [Synergistales bacterium]
MSAHRIDSMAPAGLESAFFGMGCWLNSEPRFGVVRGVWKTTVGYCGGRSANPSHEDMGDHIETVMVEYDPRTVTYGQLLDIFLNWIAGQEAQWRTRDEELWSLRPPVLRQHIPCVFARNTGEKRLAEAAIERRNFPEELLNDTLDIRVSMRHAFHGAELWRQKYFLRASHWLMKEVRGSYPDEDALVRSTLATRLNGIVGQVRPLASSCLPEELYLYDLSEAATAVLQRFLA